MSTALAVKPVTFMEMLETKQADLVKVAPKGYSIDRMRRIIGAAFARNPSLTKCKPQSVYLAVHQAVQLGLEPGGALGHAYLVPYGEECQFIIGYKGLIALARRSGEIETIEAHVVYEGDAFDVEFGTSPAVRHRPNMKGDRGAIVCVYAMAKMKGGGQQVEVMSVSDVNLIRGRSASAKRGSSPWSTDYEEMARKTVVRRLCKYLPLTIEMSDVYDAEDGLPVEQDVTEKPIRKALPPSMPTQSFASPGAADEFAAIQQDESPAPVEVKVAPVAEKPKKAPAPATPEVDTIIEQIEYAETTEDIDGVIESIEKASKRTTNPMNKPTADTLTLKANNRKAEMGGGK